MSKLNAPEINISIFGFLLNFIWEIWQVPLFQSMDNLTHFEATIRCTLAALGDVVILLVVFWIIALTARSRSWIIHPKTIQVTGFIAIGIVITVVVEAIAIHVLNRWHMPQRCQPCRFSAPGSRQFSNGSLFRQSSFP
jgi:hypothetical protein